MVSRVVEKLEAARSRGDAPLRSYELLAAVALPPLRPAAFFCAVVPPWLESVFFLPEPDALPPRLDAPGEFAIFAARSFDIPFSFSASYCFSFFTFADLLGMRSSFMVDVDIRLLQPGEENVVRELRTYEGEGGRRRSGR